MSDQGPLTLTAAIGARAWREGLQRAQADAPHLTLSFADISPIHRAFAPMARTQAFDLGEMAIVTALQAFAYGKPLIVLPVTLAARFQQRCLIARRRDLPAASDLRGRRVGVRAYTQTTGAWLRGILQNEYGVAPESIRWVTQEGAHVAEYRDPPWVEPAPASTSLPDLLRNGDIDAAILGNDLPDDPAFAPVIAEPQAAARRWYAAHGVVPINHLLVVRRDLAVARPDVIRDLWRMIRSAKPARTGDRDMDDCDMAPLGVDAVRPALEMMLRYCEQQQLLPRRFAVDEVFAEAVALVGDISVR